MAFIQSYQHSSKENVNPTSQCLADAFYSVVWQQELKLPQSIRLLLSLIANLQELLSTILDRLTNFVQHWHAYTVPFYLTFNFQVVFQLCACSCTHFCTYVVTLDGQTKAAYFCHLRVPRQLLNVHDCMWIRKDALREFGEGRRIVGHPYNLKHLNSKSWRTTTMQLSGAIPCIQYLCHRHFTYRVYIKRQCSTSNGISFCVALHLLEFIALNQTFCIKYRIGGAHGRPYSSVINDETVLLRVDNTT